ncbi:pilus assembly PilX N-terminal domain-containing protein [Deinococcus malanensis]|uniref:pilus assembly PilX N-terminal domain-containing protein n=1 Tax=Deinococcus malanensis TaxID=1706855 RepID=UPI0036386D66
MLPPVQAGLPPAPRHAQQGVALVVALLFTTIVLMIVVSTTATMTLGARKGGVNERAAYQALLAAESGINTFAVRFLARRDALPGHLQFRGTTPAALNSWLTAQGLSSYGDVTLSAATMPATGVFTLMATDSAGGARQRVLQDFYTVRQPGFNIRVEAPLQSYANVDLTAGAVVQGESRLTSTGMVQVALVTEVISLPADNGAFVVALQSTLSAQLLLGPGITWNCRALRTGSWA